jgi:hypothetical protein
MKKATKIKKASKKTVEAPKKLWAKIGVELEGAWKDVTRVLPDFKSDASVFVPNYRNCGLAHNTALVPDFVKLKPKLRKAAIKFYAGKPFSGEVASPAFESLADAEKWIDASYPDEASYRCGMHIHISFDSLLMYAAVMTEGFHDHLMRQINKFGDKHMYSNDTDKEYWTRFLGQNAYCSKSFSPLRGAQTHYGTGRYFIMNYGAFLNKNRRTFECRAFPAFRNKEMCLKALNMFIFAIEDYVENLFVADSPETLSRIAALRYYLSPEEPLAKT